jgi:hypothetical protein
MIDDTLGNLDGDAFTPGMDMYFFLRATCFYDEIWELGIWEDSTEEIDLASINL